MVVNSSPRPRGRPPRLSRESILTAALQIVDAEGLEVLTMRRLGRQLGVDPMALYRLVADKSAVCDALVERVFAEIVVPAPTGRWAHDLRMLARSSRATLLDHPGVIVLLGTRPPVTEGALMLVEAVAAILLDAGFDEEQAADGFDCLGRLLIGHTLAEAGRPPGGDVSGGEKEHGDAQDALPAVSYPAMARIRRAGIRHDPDRLFERALDGWLCVLDQQRGAAMNDS